MSPTEFLAFKDCYNKKFSKEVKCPYPELVKKWFTYVHAMLVKREEAIKSLKHKVQEEKELMRRLNQLANKEEFLAKVQSKSAKRIHFK